VTGVSVLLVEDDPAIRETTALLLESFGFTVREAGDGQAGIDAFRSEQPDVALLDVMLPRIDGISLTRLIRAESDIPVVLLSARGEHRHRLRPGGRRRRLPAQAV
jgi:DNA-binding response OmpR family regulator